MSSAIRKREGRVLVSNDLATLAEALAYMRTATSCYRPGPAWQVKHANLKANLVRGGARPYHVEVLFWHSSVIESALEARELVRKR